MSNIATLVSNMDYLKKYNRQMKWDGDFFLYK